MFLQTKGWRMVSAVGYGVMLSMALTGAVRMTYLLAGGELSQRAAGNLFLAGSAVTGALSAFLYACFLKRAQSAAAAANPQDPRD